MFDYELKEEWLEKDKAMFDQVLGNIDQVPHFTPENIQQFRDMFAPLVAPKETDQPFIDYVDQKDIFIDTTSYGASKKNMRIKVLMPKNMSKDKPTKALVYCHGGGMNMFDVDSVFSMGARHCFAGQCPVFMPDFENAPENKCPGFILECYAGFRWVIDNAHTYNLDTKRISLTGESSGGYLVSAVGVHLAKNNESHLCKSIIADIPMVSYKPWFEYPEEKLRAAQKACKEHHIRGTYGLMTQDLEEAKNTMDPYVFPAEMPDDLMAKMPPVFVATREHDNYRLDAEIFAERLLKHGKLLELYIFPGACHYTMMEIEQVMADFKRIYEFHI